jgi:hypothetical protein
MAAPAPGEEELEDALEDLDDDLAVRAARAAVENSDDELLEVPARRRKRRVVRRWDPLSPAQVNNLATRFEKHHAERAALREQPVCVGSKVSWMGGEKRWYGEIIGFNANDTVCIQVGAASRATVARALLKPRVPKLTMGRASEWANEDCIHEGVSRVRREYKHWRTAVRLQHVVDRWLEPVLATLVHGGIEFTYDGFCDVAKAAGLVSKEDQVYLFSKLVEKGKIRRRQGRPGATVRYRTVGPA